MIIRRALPRLDCRSGHLFANLGQKGLHVSSLTQRGAGRARTGHQLREEPLRAQGDIVIVLAQAMIGGWSLSANELLNYSPERSR